MTCLTQSTSISAKAKRRNNWVTSWITSYGHATAAAPRLPPEFLQVHLIFGWSKLLINPKKTRPGRLTLTFAPSLFVLQFPFSFSFFSCVHLILIHRCILSFFFYQQLKQNPRNTNTKKGGWVVFLVALSPPFFSLRFVCVFFPIFGSCVLHSLFIKNYFWFFK